ncbi:hypothetical protein EDM80_11600 [bacterium]|nr:MAG: hypothetical protein EDM80_11600 [bacterium]
MVWLNLVAAVVLALAPALEPCRLHAALSHSHRTIDLDHIHADHTHPEDADHDSDHCPKQPRHCDHHIEAAGLPALTAGTVAAPLPAVHGLSFFLRPVPRPWVQRVPFQHPPPTGVMLVGTTNLRI